MQVEDILDDLPTTPHERAELIEQLLEMIEHWDAGIKRHESYPERDEFTIDQFTDQRNKYIAQLAVLLNQYGLIVQMPTQPTTGRLAA
ncbi:hypothetical protein [Spirosoma montaniterrae]|uniref:Uncharacterized protein n=1 Tax=Spirosoma montaniterrae TaxID=1178516 RepID=A0A1P9WTB4_9BACT|nr:hypothetical protein [Spirosoma montaniterrae]AQG78621.1 hypothetical protein AWR27_04275 [Spirosoma montaniterrae]